MKKLLLAGAFTLISSVASATVLTFDSLQGIGHTPVPNGYGGFDWTTGSTIGTLDAALVGVTNTGYGTGTVSPHIIAFNWYGNSNSIIRTGDSSEFVFNGAYLTAAWADQTISISGFNNGALKYSSGIIDIYTKGPEWVNLDWTGIDTLVIYNNGSQWVMDNFTVNEAIVPESSSLVIFGLGLVAMVSIRRRMKV